MVSPALSWLLDPVPVPRAGRADGLPDGLTRQEVAALLSEGLVVAAAGGYLPVDAAGSPTARAATLRERLEPDAVVGGEAALWVRGAVETCDVVDVLVPRGRTGGSLRDPAGWRTRTAALEPHDVELVCGLVVTTLERTAADVAVWHPPHVAAPLLRAAAEAGADPLGVLEALSGPTRPGQRQARRRLQAQLRALPVSR